MRLKAKRTSLKQKKPRMLISNFSAILQILRKQKTNNFPKVKVYI